jgi:hypothetical protein
MNRFLALGACLALLAAPAMTTAADNDEKNAPAVKLQIQSVEKILGNAEYVAKLIGKEEEAKQFLGFIKSLTGDNPEKGIEGIDLKKPFVAYASLAAEIEKSEIVVMIPIADQKAFIELLKGRLALEIKDEGKGLWSTQAPNNLGAVYFRFANNYVYATFQNKDNVDEKNLQKPEAVYIKGDSVISLSLRIDRVPEALKQFALASLETALAGGKQQKLPPELEKLDPVKDKAIDSLAGGIKSILSDGKEITLKLDVDPKKDDISLALELTAKDGSELAKDIADFKTRKSVAFGALSMKNTALLLTLNASLPTSVKKVFGPAVDDLVKQGLDMAGDFKEHVEPLVKALVPTLKAGDLDIGVAVVGPNADKHLSGVLVAKVVEGKKIDAAIKDLVEKIPEPIKSAIDLNADSEGAYKIHVVKIKDQLDENIKKIIGETDVYVAFRDDALMVSFGPSGKSLIKEALKSQPAAGPIFKAEVSASKIAALVAADRPKAAEKALAETFGKIPGGDTISLTVEGGTSLTVKVAIKGKVIQMFVLLDKYKSDN